MRGASVEDVQAAVARMIASAELDWRVEEASDYPGYDIAIDVYARSQLVATAAATNLIQDLRASTTYKLEMAEVLDPKIVAREKRGIGSTSD